MLHAELQATTLQSIHLLQHLAPRTSFAHHKVNVDSQAVLRIINSSGTFVGSLALRWDVTALADNLFGSREMKMCSMLA